MKPADTTHVRAMLAGGDRRSTGRADELAADALDGRIDAGAVFAAMFDEDEIVRMRAADALEKISVQSPDCLRPFKRDFLDELPDIEQAEVRWHAAQMLPRFPLTAAERRDRAMPVLLKYLRDKSRIVQTFALQALADFAAVDATLRPRVLALVEVAARTGSPAVKARCRPLLKSLSKQGRDGSPGRPSNGSDDQRTHGASHRKIHGRLGEPSLPCDDRPRVGLPRKEP